MPPARKDRIWVCAAPPGSIRPSSDRFPPYLNLDVVIVRVRMKLQGELINRQIDGDGVIEGDVHVAVADRYLNVRFLCGNAEILNLLENVVADVVDALFGVSGQREARFTLDRVLKLVVRDVDRDEFYGNEAHGPEHHQRQEHIELGAAAFWVAVPCQARI